MKQSWVGISAAFVIVAAGQSRAAIVTLSGDLGSNTWTSPPATLLSGGSLTVPFVHNFAGRGSIQGDFQADYTGTTFLMKITNLSFHAFDWSPMGKTDVRIVVTQAFDALPGPFAATQGLDGFTESTTSGGVVIGNTILDSGFTSVSLPPVSYGSSSGAPQFFSVPPTFGMTTTSHLDMLIKMQLDMTIFGDGTILLPNSFESTTIPAPAAALGLALAGAFGARRRRSV